ncbi:hypothetical protein [Reyranella sp.]|uniref:hypothetical protein n=1 Tax=Reyranella sp. TaxID=1929291 RepID=UPI003D0F20BD
MALFGKSREMREAETAALQRAQEITAELTKELLDPYRSLANQQAEIKGQLADLTNEIENFPKLIGERTQAYSIEQARKFEYAIASTDMEGFSSTTLDLLGSLGWEMVSSSAYAIGGSTQTVNFQYTFKREKLSLPNEELKLLGSEHEARVAMISGLEEAMLDLQKQKEVLLAKARSIDPVAPELLIKLGELEEKSSKNNPWA